MGGGRAAGGLGGLGRAVAGRAASPGAAPRPGAPAAAGRRRSPPPPFAAGPGAGAPGEGGGGTGAGVDGPGGRERERSPRGRRSRDSRREAWPCPGCGQLLRRLEKVPLHARGCCPDLWDQGAWDAATGDSEALRGLLEAWRLREVALRTRAAAAAWGAEDGVRREVPAVAARLGLPEDRVRRMLKAYSKATPLAADDTPVEVLKEDAAVLALNKPPGLRSTPRHRFEGNSLLGRAIGHLQRAAGVTRLPEEGMPRVVHRLDMDTSGVVVFGKTREATSGLTRQFAAREASKTYLALVAGVPGAMNFEVDAAIARDDAHEVGMRVADSSEGGGKPSRTLVRVLASRPEVSVGGSPRLGDSEPLAWKRALGEGRWPQGVSLVEATPLTGRTHQIRLHLSHAGFPILGDTVYGVFGGEGGREGEGEDLWGLLRRQALHARSLKVVHPATGSSVRYSAALPADMLRAAEHLGLEVPGDVRSSGAERVAEGDDAGGSKDSAQSE